MMINALNSGANVFMADFEDANAPTWENNVRGQQNLRDAVAGTIAFTSAEGKRYALEPRTATLVVRPRGWHLVEKHMLVDGAPIAAALFDFGLAFFHNAAALVARGTGPYYYVPKLESHLEARLWNDVFTFAQDRLGVPRGTIRATVLIETILAAFETDEILWELRDHAAGLNCGRWDYIFSYIKKFKDRPECVLPDRGAVGRDHRGRPAQEPRRGAALLGGVARRRRVRADLRPHGGRGDRGDLSGSGVAVAPAWRAVGGRAAGDCGHGATNPERVGGDPTRTGRCGWRWGASAFARRADSRRTHDRRGVCGVPDDGRVRASPLGQEAGGSHGQAGVHHVARAAVGDGPPLGRDPATVRCRRRVPPARLDRHRVLARAPRGRPAVAAVAAGQLPRRAVGHHREPSHPGGAGGPQRDLRERVAGGGRREQCPRDVTRSEPLPLRLRARPAPPHQQRSQTGRQIGRAHV